ncbi:hypothetical protein BH11MYX3_BH11MYX3_38940 [soil metagenome]
MKLTRVVAVLAHPITIATASLGSLALQRRAAIAPRLFVALPVSVLGSKLLKRLFPRHKPRLLTLTPRESFPSGHTAAVTAAAAALVEGYGSWRALPLAIGAVVGIGAARIHDDEHRLDEVLVGAALGVVGAAAGSLVARAIAHRRRATAARAAHPPRL